MIIFIWLFPALTRCLCQTFEFFGKFRKQQRKLETEIERENRRPANANGQHDIEQMSIGSERPDGRLEVDETKPKHFTFFWQKEYNPAPEDETDSADTDNFNIQCRWTIIIYLEIFILEF